MNTFLNTTWSGLQTAADLGFTAMSTSVKDNWEAAEPKMDASWNAQKTLLEDVWCRYIPCAWSHAVRCAKMFRERERR